VFFTPADIPCMLQSWDEHRENHDMLMAYLEARELPPSPVKGFLALALNLIATVVLAYGWWR
jgi:hypothetical protein